ncbi:hypothetical protein Ndes2526B_g08327 [Nannochloris sp. 'desiccata']|nr:hypothetical protein KSW81_001793 [Chlorella desiccata (nom. nud.)]KAH7616227.1 putative Pentatricopeptide repeat-containing protein MRL1, chloroplastic [Chlorella desiccata (nom. nud.)]
MQTTFCVANSAGIGQTAAGKSHGNGTNKRRLGATPAKLRVPRAASSDPAVLLNVATHSDGTITFSFGAENEVPPVVASIPLAAPNSHHEAPEATASAARVAETNGATTTTVPTTVAAVQQLDKLLHLTPEVSDGHSLPLNGASENGNGASHRNGAGKTHSRDANEAAEDNGTGTNTEIEDESVAVAKKLAIVAAANRKQAAASASISHAATTTIEKTPQPSSSTSTNKSPLTPQTVDYRDAPAVTVDRLYSRLCDSGKLDDALFVVKECIRAGRGDVLKMFKHYKFLRPAQRQRSVRRAMRFVQLIPRQFVDPRTYNMLLSVCAEAGDVKSAVRVADMLRAAGHKMDTILYTNIIKVCAAAGDAEHAFKLYNEMKAAGVKTEKQVYATLISACSEQILITPQSDRRTQLVLLERAFSLVQNMQSARLPTDAAVWNALVTASGRAGQLQRAFDVLEEMLAAGLRPNARTYSSLIDACARTGDKELALRVYAKARREGFEKELQLYSAAINACVRAKSGPDLNTAMEIYADLQRASVAPDSALFGALLMAAGRSGDLNLALELEGEMQREGLQPCSGTESALLNVHLQHGLLKEAQAIYKRLRASNAAPHIHAANALINALGKERRLGDVVALVCDMIDAGLTPDAFTFAGILGACQRSDECELGLDVYRVMRVRNVPVDNIIAESMLRLCYNRLRQSWRPGGYPPQRLSDERNKSTGRLSSSLYHSSGGQREQERLKLLTALTPPGRKLTPATDTGGAVNWTAHAFSVFREASSEGRKPSMRLLNLMFACLRVPWEDATGGEGDQSLNLALQTQRLLAGLPSAVEGAPQVQGKIGIESIYHVRAISILEEAIVSGLLPSFKAGAPAPIDLRALPPAVAEVYVLTVVSALQRVVEARRELKNRIVFLVPRYDGHKVFMPSFLNDEGSSSDDESYGNHFKSMNGARPSDYPPSASHLTTLTVADTAIEDEASSDEDIFSGALKQDELCTGDERTGLGVAGVLRRLRLWSREYSPEGLIVVEPRQVMKWAKMIQRQVESRSASALAVQKPYGQQSGDDLRRQSSSIRSRGF